MNSAQSDVWIAVDWGTSNVRFWAISKAAATEGDILNSASADKGAGALQSDEFEACLLDHVSAWLNQSGPTDVVICGMAGARNGWREAPYADVTADIAEIARNAVSVPCDHQGLNVRILPGLSQQSPPDVVRGEETQLVGLLRHEPHFTGWVVMPGTHSKWVKITAGSLKSSCTAMTGEIFALLKSQSILRHSLATQERGDASDDLLGTAFSDAVQEVWQTPALVLPGLFQLRASDILGVSQQEVVASAADRAARLSGLLIGWEIYSVLSGKATEEEICIVGSAYLGSAYQCAFAQLGLKSRQLQGDKLVLGGLKSAYDLLT